MGSLSPIHLIILSAVALLALSGYGRIRSRLTGERPLTRAGPRRGFFHGMNAATSLALAGAMLLALALLVDVYGPNWTPGAPSENLSLGLAGSGGILTLLSFFLDRRTRNRG